jgi:hypothetical protein
VSSSTGEELHAVAAIAMHAYRVAVMDLRMTPGGSEPGRPDYFCAATEYNTWVLRVLRNSSSGCPRMAA